MAVKIIDLTEESVPSNDDWFIIRDNATGTTRKITRSNFFLNPPIPNGALTTAMYGDGTVTKIKLDANAKLDPRITTTANPSTITPNSDTTDIYTVTALAQSLTINSPTGTPANGQAIMLRFKDNGTLRSLTWGSDWRAVGVTIPTATTASKMLYVAARYNTEALKWDVLSVGREV